MKYAEGADVQNVAMFDMTAKELCDGSPDKKGGIRNYTDVNQLICLTNLETLNAFLLNRRCFV